MSEKIVPIYHPYYSAGSYSHTDYQNRNNPLAIYGFRLGVWDAQQSMSQDDYFTHNDYTNWRYDEAVNRYIYSLRYNLVVSIAGFGVPMDVIEPKPIWQYNEFCAGDDLPFSSCRHLLTTPPTPPRSLVDLSLSEQEMLVKGWMDGVAAVDHSARNLIELQEVEPECAIAKMFARNLITKELVDYDTLHRMWEFYESDIQTFDEYLFSLGHPRWGSLNLTISSIQETTYNDKSGYHVSVENGDDVYVLIEKSQQCCEDWGYLVVADGESEDFSYFYGATISKIEAIDGESYDSEDVWTDKYSFACFVRFHTNRGVFTLAVYNSHNGYYSHDIQILFGQESYESSL